MNVEKAKFIYRKSMQAIEDEWKHGGYAEHALAAYTSVLLACGC